MHQEEPVTENQTNSTAEVLSSGWQSSDTVAGGQMQFISFAIGDDQYGVDIMSVREIKGWSTATHLPRQPEYIRGVLNLRGVMVPIFDLRCRFGQGKTDASPMHVVIIVSVENRLVGLLADRVLDIVAVDTAEIQPIPQMAKAARITFLAGLVTLSDGMIALIDLQNLLGSQQDAEATAREPGAAVASTVAQQFAAVA